jgi:hypothetical protein
MGSQLSNMFTNTQGVLIDNETNYSINTNANKIVHTKISSCDYCNKILILKDYNKENICNICREKLVLKRLKLIGIFN